jgi:A/G-specific adenine glycosylase
MAARHRVKSEAKRAPGTEISRLLLAWYARNHRDLPWRNTRDPYPIWVSEIMLQQTRAQAVIPYYHRFLARFPSVEALAAAAEDEVLARWSGLGYYSRARNLRLAAQQIASAGGFPRDYAAIRALPGIGDYTAAAIGSIAFDLPIAVLDGNVLRVVARMSNDASDISAGRTRDRFREIAQQWLDPREPGQFNQALMELGATVCLPRNPLCLVCPLAACCGARQEGTAAQLPVKLRKTAAVRLSGVLLVVRRRGRILLRQRDAGNRRMAGFWELPAPQDLPAAQLGARIGEIRHTITHHHYTLEVRSATSAQLEQDAFRWFTVDQLAGIPLSTTARKALHLSGFVPNL